MFKGGSLEICGPYECAIIKTCFSLKNYSTEFLVGDSCSKIGGFPKSGATKVRFAFEVCRISCQMSTKINISYERCILEVCQVEGAAQKVCVTLELGFTKNCGTFKFRVPKISYINEFCVPEICVAHKIAL